MLQKRTRNNLLTYEEMHTTACIGIYRTGSCNMAEVYLMHLLMSIGLQLDIAPESDYDSSDIIEGLIAREYDPVRFYEFALGHMNPEDTTHLSYKTLNEKYLHDELMVFKYFVEHTWIVYDACEAMVDYILLEGMLYGSPFYYVTSPRFLIRGRDARKEGLVHYCNCNPLWPMPFVTDDTKKVIEIIKKFVSGNIGTLCCKK